MKEFAKDMETLKDLYDKADKITDVLGVENEVMNVIYETFEYAVELTEQKYDNNTYHVDGGWISWYVYENEWGENEYEAGYDKKVKPIKNYEDLYELIQIGLERNNVKDLRKMEEGFTDTVSVSEFFDIMKDHIEMKSNAVLKDSVDMKDLVNKNRDKLND